MTILDALLKAGALMVGGVLGVSSSEAAKRLAPEQPLLIDAALASGGAYMVYRQALKDPKSAWLFFWVGYMGESAVRGFRVLMGEKSASPSSPPPSEPPQTQTQPAGGLALLLTLLPGLP